MIAQPALVQATSVLTGELRVRTRGSLRTVVQSRVLIGPIDTIGIAVAQPFLRYALRPVPHFVGGTREFRLFVALPVVALVPLVLVRVVQAIVVAVADVNPRYAIAIVAGEQVAEASAALGLAVLGWLVAAVQAIVVSVAVPSGGDAAVIRATEAVLRTSALCAVKWILVAVVAAIVVTVAQPIGFHADVGFVAFEMIRRTSGVGGASLVRLVRSDVVLAVVDAVAQLRVGYATVIGAGELALGARRIDATLLVAAVATVVLVVALPRLEDATAVVAAELVGAARVISCVKLKN